MHVAYIASGTIMRARLGWQAGILNPAGGKPKGMHWKTYQRLTNDYCTEAHRAMAGMSARLGLTMGRLEKMNQAADKYL